MTLMTRYPPLASAVVFGLAVAGLALATSVIAVPTAGAQSIADSFAGFSSNTTNPNEPIEIEADTLEVMDKDKIAIFSGNVNARQGKFTLLSKKLKVTYAGGLAGTGGGKKKTDGKNQNAIKLIEATGKVAISTADNQSATSDWAKFDVPSSMVTIGGNVVLSQGDNVMRGDKLIIDLKTGLAHFDGATRGKGKNGKRPRVRGVFLPGSGKNGRPGIQAGNGTDGSSANSHPPLPTHKNDASNRR